MASRKRQKSKPLSRLARQRATQTKERDLLILRVEHEYTKIVQAQERSAHSLIEAWIKREAVDAGASANDAGEAQLIAALRRLFGSPKSLLGFFGRMAALVGSSVDRELGQTIPSIDRKKLVTPKALSRFAGTNAGLIKKLPQAQAARLAKVVRTGSGRHVEAMQREFQQAFGATEAKARLWARDQTLKLHAQITQERHTQLGISRYYWTDSNDDRVRRIHGELGDASDNGKQYSYKDPPTYNEQGDKGNPGEDYQCRCTAYPVL